MVLMAYAIVRRKILERNSGRVDFGFDFSAKDGVSAGSGGCRGYGGIPFCHGLDRDCRG